MMGIAFSHIPAANTYWANTITAVVAFLVITFLHVVIGEQVPKCIALQYPEKFHFMLPNLWIFL